MQLTKKIIALFLWLLIATACGGEGENPPVTPTEDEIEVLPGMTLTQLSALSSREVKFKLKTT